MVAITSTLYFKLVVHAGGTNEEICTLSLVLIADSIIDSRKVSSSSGGSKEGVIFLGGSNEGTIFLGGSKEGDS